MPTFSIDYEIRPETISDVLQLVDLVRPDILRTLMTENPAPDQRTDNVGGLTAKYHDKSGLWIFYDENDERLRDTETVPPPIQYKGPVGYKEQSAAKQMLRLAYQQQEDLGLPSRVWFPSYDENFDRIVPS